VWHAWAVANYDQLKKVDNPKESKETNTSNSSAGLTAQQLPSTMPPIPPNMSMPPKNHSINLLSPPHKHVSHQSRIPYSTPRNLTTSGGSASMVNYLLPIQQVDSVTEYVKEAIKVEKQYPCCYVVFQVKSLHKGFCEVDSAGTRAACSECAARHFAIADVMVQVRHQERCTQHSRGGVG